MPDHEHPSNALAAEHLAVVRYEVAALASRLPPHIHRDDLVSAGHLALVRAARAYEPGTGVPFARYAALRVRGALIDELRTQDWAPRRARQAANRIVEATNELTSALGRTPTTDDVAEHTGMTTAQLVAARSASEMRVLSMDAGPDESALADSVPDPDVGPEGRLLADERDAYLHAAVDALPDKMRAVVRGLFFEGRTPAELADGLGLTQSRVSQMRTEAMALMRDGINTHLDPDLVAAPEKPTGAVVRRRQEYYARVAAAAAQSAARSAVVPVAAPRSTRAAEPVVA